MLELDPTPDYYGCNSEEAKEPVPRVSARPRMRKMGGCRSKNQQWCSLVKSLNFLEESWREIKLISSPDCLGLRGQLLCGLYAIVGRAFISSCFSVVAN